MNITIKKRNFGSVFCYRTNPKEICSITNEHVIPVARRMAGTSESRYECAIGFFYYLDSVVRLSAATE
jgi:hypothetical protein